MPTTRGSCAVCQKCAETKCSSCNAVFYCGKDHQKEDWPKHRTNCPTYKVEMVPEGGGGPTVISTRSIKKGNAIVSEAPLIVGLHYKLNPHDVCLGCYQQTEIRSRCSQCTWPICSPRCPGMRDPTRHGAECLLLREIQAPLFLKTYLLPLRCLLLQKSDPSKWETLLEMAQHAVNVKPTHPSRESRIVFEESILKPLSRKAPGLLPDCSKETVRKVFNVLDMFGLSIHIPDFGPLIAVFPVASAMAHSCLPNTQRFVDVPPVAPGQPWRLRLVVRAIAPIARGENISTVFTDTWMCSFARQGNLRSRRNAPCGCARCSDPTELGTNFGTLRCSICAGWVLPSDPPQVDLSEWECQTCGNVSSPEEIRFLLCELQKEMAPFEIEKRPHVAKCEAMLVRLQKVLHPNHHYCVLLKGEICDYFDTLIDVWAGTLPETAMTMSQLERTAELCRDLINLLENPAIVTQEIHGPKLSECLRQLATVNSEIAKRKRLAGIWSLDRANKAIKESKDTLKRGVALRNSVFDHSSTEMHDSVELLKKLVISRGQN